MSPVIVAAALFSAGVYVVLSRRDVVGILVGIETMMAGVLVVLVVLGARSAEGAQVHAIALLVLVLAAAEAAVGLALLVAGARRMATTRIDEMTEVKG